MLQAKTIGNKIAEARKKNQLSQSQLGEQLFISAQAVGKWERGESLPDLILFHRLAGILGMDLSYFTGEYPAEINPTFDHSTKETTPEKLNWNK